MNSKQRVHAALKREPVDRIPIFMWYHPETPLENIFAMLAAAGLSREKIFDSASQIRNRLIMDR